MPQAGHEPGPPGGVSKPEDPVVALLPWGDLIDDFLDSIGLSFDDFRLRMTGGWLFGYVEALKTAGVRTVLVCVSARVSRPSWHTHEPTGAEIVLLPTPWAYRVVRRQMVNPYGPSFDDQFGPVEGLRRPVLRLLRHLAPYLATPPVRLARLLRQQHPTAVLTQEYEHARFDVTAAVGRLTGVPVLATFQGGDAQTSRLERPLRPLTLRMARGLVVATRRERERLGDRYGLQSEKGEKGEKVVAVFNPLDLEFWRGLDKDDARRALGLPEGARVVVCHGRIDLHRKGLDVLVEAWSRVSATRADRDVRLLLVGTGPDSEKLRALIAAAGLCSVSWRDEYVVDQEVLRRYLSAADAYVLASRHEGFPVAPLEAMACGLPVVAADAPGVTDILDVGEDSGGLVVPTGDSAALAAALGRVIDDRAWAEELGRRGRRRVEDAFSLEVVGRRLRGVLVDGTERVS